MHWLDPVCLVITSRTDIAYGLLFCVQEEDASEEFSEPRFGRSRFNSF